jgi:adenylate cyclase
MLIGSVGGAHHYEYRAVGDIVNTASRIQGLNKALGTRVLASEATVEGLDRFTTRPLGSFLLAGKSNAVSLVELIGAQQDVTAGRTILCQAFAAALGAYRAGLWREAEDRFSGILRSFPEDGPSRFYRERCQHLLLNPPVDAWGPTVRIDAK